MKVELAQLAGRDNDTAYNLERALAAIAACAADTQLIVFPETSKHWHKPPNRWTGRPSALCRPPPVNTTLPW